MMSHTYLQGTIDEMGDPVKEIGIIVKDYPKCNFRYFYR